MPTSAKLLGGTRGFSNEAQNALVTVQFHAIMLRLVNLGQDDLAIPFAFGKLTNCC